MGFTAEEIADGATLYGLYGPMRGFGHDIHDPHRIIIYKRPLEENFADTRELMIEIRKTVIHELAHHFGWSDRDLERFDSTEDPFGDPL